MCGLVGFLGSGVGESGDEVLTRRMANTLNHRGPDDGGVWCDGEQRIALGHRRLAIVDLSPAGHQPMMSASGRYVIAFNGEIYNHLDLRKELEQIPTNSTLAKGRILYWHGHSDTETLLVGIEAWGLEATLKKSIGMFAIALWDRQTRTLSLARDRIGEKPLYYGWQGSNNERVFLFGSELKALKAHPAFATDIDRDALCLLLRHNYIPAPYSIYQGIAKLGPGCLLSISLAQPEPRIWKYWDAVEVALAGVAQPFAGTADEAVDALEVLAKDAVRQQMMADVPLGAFLSGGIDSSTVVALMQAQSSRPVKTFTIGFNEEGYNEAVHAKTVARHLGTEHTELYVSPQQAMEVIPRLSGLYCEPFADSSQIPTYLVSQLAKQHVTVSLSGDAGDELFCGYSRYLRTLNIWKKVSLAPAPLRALAARGIKSISPSTWDSFAHFIPGTGRLRFVGDKFHKGAGVLASTTVDELYMDMVSHLRNPEEWVIGGQEPPTHLTALRPDLAGLGDVERMMALDTISYLPDDILVKVDRAAMGVSLEGRVPFLDRRVVEFSWSLPLEYKLRDGQTKWPLRQVLYRHVPRELIDRPKMGFGVPLHDWLRGPMREWAEDLLDETRLTREGYFHPAPIRQMWAEHLSGQRNWMARLWCVLMFQAWLEMENRK
ncbi:asparagine synthase (glutamine-hydrolyzing) [Nitrosomonas supralitoralis]|uniref:asparagine synthase (glutamine-hydrolyzing) n=1 Tax=Nitrosomonas supralitoralis TaxID=2116706 RepID=A0A2P7NWY3_9PROT|nr:asparagine synthase (glutamine-hydrolyzing) [Nitrosomonas supralitoralis]PSJ17973.1 asparagine synthase (glutamine-hydrolyzing) [Nitrosomonas supralitoralis]